MMPSPQNPLRALFTAAFGLMMTTSLGAAEPAPARPPISTAADVLSLSGEEAGQRLPVSVTGVVTAAEPDWNGQFFVQDATGGVFVENLGHTPPALGDVVHIDGVSHPGAFAPIISEPQWRVVGTAPLPEPKPARIENLKAGAEDGMRVEITGVVRTARIENNRLALDLSVAGNRLQVNARVPPATPPESLIATHVCVRGTVATHYNEVLRHLTSVAVYVPRLEDFTVLEREREDPFRQPPTPASNIAQYRRGRGSDERVHVRGVVTLQRVGDEIFLQDESGGIRIETTQPDAFALGEQIDAAGFIEYENYLPLLRDAVLRPAGLPPAPVPPRPVTFAEISRGQHHGDLVSLRGRILDRSTRPESRGPGNFRGFTTTWLVQGSEITFTVEYEARAESAALAAVPVGSIVEVSGVCVSTVDGTGRLTALRLLLPSPAGLRVLARPSWFTPARLLAGVGILGAVLLVALAWLLTIARKNATLKQLVHELEHAQRELQEAHDTLEQKVIERSAQLQVEMTARKTAEVQFKAVLAERTRLARELHDTLEQTLTGIALHLDTSAKLAPRDAAASREHLQLARNWLHQSQVELRRSIWDLRSRELEQFDLAAALRRSAEQLADGGALKLDFHATGLPRNLPEVVEENVLRIGQEALTNIAKHAHASRVEIAFEVEDHLLRLRIRDDGVGFEPASVPGASDGHYGLTGMAERAKRIGGRVVVTSGAGRGTAITVEIPLAASVSPAGPPPVSPPLIA
jgi:signal transduction histidine kinase